MTRARTIRPHMSLRGLPTARGLWSAFMVFAALMLCVSPQGARAQSLCATSGNDGPNAALSGIVNTYYPGVGTASGTTISVGAPTGAATTISAGDLLLVIQMQDVQINSNNSTSYGDGVAGGTASGALAANFNAGLYEYVVAVSFTGATITVKGRGAGNGLVNTYATAAATATQGRKTFQVVRVPQYSSATISGTLTAPAWDGTTGGVVAIDVAGTLALNGSVNVDAKGFRGGGGRGLAGPSPASAVPLNTDYVQLSSYNLNGQKGEGIAGTPHYVYDGTSVIDTGVEGYPNGSTARGAPGNAGGGGTDGATNNNEENSGGGGGGNSGAGGLGGLTWRTRLNIGGYGGVMSVAPAATRVVMGGGGGAASRNNSSTVASSGGAGGGIVMIRAGILNGSGTVSANGEDAYNLTLNDGGGGGGAGGSILVSATTYSGAVALNARGGRGGDAWNTQAVGTICGSAPCDTDNRHGPGGGGGGGYVATTWSGAGNVAGGAHGITTTTTAPNNAYSSTDGSLGTSATLTAANIPGANSGAQCVPSLTVTKTTSTAAVRNTPTGVTATYTITVANAANRSTAASVTLSDTLPTLFTYASTGTVSFAGGATRPSITNPTVGAAVPAWSLFTIPGGGSVALTFTVNIAYNAAGTYQNPATATYLDPTRTTTNGTTSASYNSGSSTGEDVTVTGSPRLTLDKQCIAPANCTTQAQTPNTELTYSITFINDGGANAVSFVLYDMIPANTVFKVGSVTYNAGTSGIAAPTVDYSQQARSAAAPPVPPSPWVAYTPPGAAGTLDANVTWVRWRFAANIPAGASASVTFIVRIP
jgi:uncharacterized repeat protein (TIGR01451 family)